MAVARCPECAYILRYHCVSGRCRWLFCNLCWTLVHRDTRVVILFPKNSPPDENRG